VSVVAEVLLICFRIVFSENPHIPRLHAPWWVEATIFLISLAMVRHHYQEWKIRRSEADIPELVGEILQSCETSRTPATGRIPPEAKKVLLEAIMTKMVSVLERDKSRQIAFSLMEPLPSGVLGITFFHPPNASFSGSYTLRLDQGAAGTAFSKGNPIYVPSTRHLMGIDVESYETIGQIYEPDPPECRYHSVLCVPVIQGGKATGVLNISSTKIGSLDLFEFGIGKMMGAMIAAIS